MATINTTRKAAVAVGCVAATALQAHRLYWRWADRAPATEPPATATALPRSVTCTVCAAVPPHALGAPHVPGRNYATIDEATLRSGVDRLLSVLPEELATYLGQSCVTSDFGIETAVKDVWAGASTREPRWVGDKQAVLLWLSLPCPAPLPASLSAAISRQVLLKCVDSLGGDQET